MSKIQTKIVDANTGQSLGYGVNATIVKAGDKKGEQIGTGFITDDNGLLVIESPLLDYKTMQDAVDVIVATKGYKPNRVSPDELVLGDLKLSKTTITKLTDKAKDKAKHIPMWAWMSGGVGLGIVTVIVLLIKKKK